MIILSFFFQISNSNEWEIIEENGENSSSLISILKNIYKYLGGGGEGGG